MKKKDKRRSRRYGTKEPSIFGVGRHSHVSTTTKNSFSVIPIVANYQDLFTDKVGNNAAYSFWRKKVSERVKDPEKRELLAPVVPPHSFGCKRPSQEQYFYEIFNQDNVDLVDINLNPVTEITPKGLKTTEKEFEFDVLILATGARAGAQSRQMRN